MSVRTGLNAGRGSNTGERQHHIKTENSEREELYDVLAGLQDVNISLFGGKLSETAL